MGGHRAHRPSFLVRYSCHKANALNYDDLRRGYYHYSSSVNFKPIRFHSMHELGHVALDHPSRLHKEKIDGRDLTSLRHEFEFAADTFALGLSRSHLVREIRLNSENSGESQSPIDKIASSLRDYQGDLCGVYLLFIYMDFVQKSGELLRDRVGNKIRIRAHMDSHPESKLRLERLELMNASEFLYSGKLQRYAKVFFASVLEYAKSLDDNSLTESLSVY